MAKDYGYGIDSVERTKAAKTSRARIAKRTTQDQNGSSDFRFGQGQYAPKGGTDVEKSVANIMKSITGNKKKRY